MTRRRVSPFMIFVGAWTGLMLITLTRFPVVYFDEIEYANHAWNWLLHGRIEYSLYDQLYPAQLYEYRHLWPVIIRPFFVWVLGAFIQIGGISLFVVRLPSVLAGAAVLGLTAYLAGRCLATAREQWTALALLGSNAYFLMVARFTRPEVVLTLVGLTAFIFFLKGVESKRARTITAWTAASGLLAGSSMGWHTNGVAIIAALFTLWIMFRRGKIWRDRGFWSFSLGAVVGLFLFSLVADWERFMVGYKFLFFRELNRPPILATLNPIAIVVGELDRYLQPWVFTASPRAGHLWKIVQSAGWILFFSGLVYFLPPSRTKNQPLRLTVWFSAFLVVYLALFIGYKAPSYIAILLPYAAVITSALAGRFMAKRWPAAITLTVVAGVVIGSLIFVGLQHMKKPTYASTAVRLSELIPAGSRVAAPMIYWLALHDRDFRDVGGLNWYRLLAGEKDPMARLADFKPEYVVLEAPFAHRLGQNRPGQSLFPWPATILAQFDTGPDYGGRLFVFHLRWNQS